MVKAGNEFADLLRINVALVRTPGHTRDCTSQTNPVFFCRGCNGLKTGKALFNCAVDIGLTKFLSGTAKNRDIFDVRLESILKATHIGDEDAIFNTRFLLDLGGNLIGQLHGRNHSGADKFSNFNRRKSSIGQSVNQFNSEFNRDEMFKPFQAIPSGEINDFYLCWQ